MFNTFENILESIETDICNILFKVNMISHKKTFSSGFYVLSQYNYSNYAEKILLLMQLVVEFIISCKQQDANIIRGYL